jgi:anaerobic selenocysteine-containing dehydrogenase
MTPDELIDHTLKVSGWPGLDTLKAERWIDVQPDFETAHFLNGFGHADGRFHFKADWSHALNGFGPAGTPDNMPGLPDHWDVIDRATGDRPFRLVTAPARNYLNSSFTETPTSIARERRPTAKIHPDDAAPLGISDGGRVRLGNDKGSVLLHAELFDGLTRGTVIVESVWPNHAFEEGIGINLLISSDPGAPVGGGLFHDTSIWVRPG